MENSSLFPVRRQLELRETPRAFEIETQLASADAREMRVRVDQAGQERTLAQVDHVVR